MEDKFHAIFEQWAEYYDDTVYGEDNEYSEVFHNYEGILEKIAESIKDKKTGKLVEIGAGTGNLMNYLITKGFNVVGIEPSNAMRLVAKRKNKQINMVEGDFLNIPIEGKLDGVVSSYAFHHLTYEDKVKAIDLIDNLLNKKGRIVIADTMFMSKAYKEDLLARVKQSNANQLLNDLKTEYYELLDDILMIFRSKGYLLDITQMNNYVWIVNAMKQ